MTPNLSEAPPSQTIDKDQAQHGLVATSPVQEHHIDFLLEEEFICNEAFLLFFLKQARQNMLSPWNDPDHEARLTPCEVWKCHAVRSTTTSAGESDLLVIFQSSATATPRVAILIEDKIRARFQNDQAKRYNQRGVDGVEAGHWDAFFTCLMAPQKYAKDNEGFDTRISLERLVTFFSGEDSRAKFKAGVIERAVLLSAATGIQKVDPAMTGFRALYAQMAEQFFGSQEVTWDAPRDAWYDDTWFTFRSPEMVGGVKILYKAKMGAVELSYPDTKAVTLQERLQLCDDGKDIATKQTGMSAAFFIHVQAVTAFENPQNARAIMKESLLHVKKLLDFHHKNRLNLENAS